jgi:hypothetical protein
MNAVMMNSCFDGGSLLKIRANGIITSAFFRVIPDNDVDANRTIALAVYERHTPKAPSRINLQGGMNDDTRKSHGESDY